MNTILKRGYQRVGVALTSGKTILYFFSYDNILQNQNYFLKKFSLFGIFFLIQPGLFIKSKDIDRQKNQAVDAVCCVVGQAEGEYATFNGVHR